MSNRASGIALLSGLLDDFDELTIVVT